jgi:type II secretory pathway pseudopilin PulG
MKRNQGQSIVEVVIAMTILSIIMAAISSLALSGHYLLIRSSQFIQAQALANEGLEAIRAIRQQGWNNLAYNQSAVAASGGEWVLAGEGTSENIGLYTRTIKLLPIYRDSTNRIASSTDPGAVLDPDSREVQVAVSWEIRPGVRNTLLTAAYLTDF